VATRRSTIPAPAARPEPTTVDVFQPERTIVRDVDNALPIALSGPASPATVESRLPAGCRVKQRYSLPGEASASTAPTHTPAPDDQRALAPPGE
jgi:hypothetical protein